MGCPEKGTRQKRSDCANRAKASWQNYHFIESLSGRKLIFEILPLSFAEFLEFQGVKYKTKGIDISEPEKWKFDKFAFQTLSSCYEEYIEFGGFPAVAMSESRERKKQLLDVIYSSYINMDVKQLADLSGGAKFENTVCHQLGFFGKLSFYNDKSGEIDFILQVGAGLRASPYLLAIEIKETPIKDYLLLAEKRAGKIGINKVGLVGRFESKTFTDYAWGGEI